MKRRRYVRNKSWDIFKPLVPTTREKSTVTRRCYLCSCLRDIADMVFEEGGDSRSCRKMALSRASI